nr:hypothetical protein [Acidobacteriota bacterium]MCU0479340.1 hypothetical protein [Chloroflexota bacterium]
GLCNSANRSPVFVTAALDNTLVKVDFNNDGLFDYIDTNSDDYPENGVANDGTCATPVAPWNVPGLTNCVYRIDALQSLRVYDYTDYDNTGTRVQASKPVAMAYGQDTDQADGGDPILDTGYTVYPLSQRFLDPVLIVGKTASPTVVSGTTGGQATFTITVRSYAFAPLTSLTVTDLLPSGLAAANYVAGSTLVTYPDLSQSTADPSSAIDGATGRTRLNWALSPNTLGLDQTLTIAFRVSIPAGTARTFSNEAFATAIYAGRTFSAVGGADVVRTNISLTKLATDDGAPEPGDVVTYTLLARNNGGSAETTVGITDAIPAGTTFVTGSITTGAPFAGAYSAQQNAVVWTAASFASGTSATLTFQVRVNPDTDVGTVIPNRGIYESTQTPTFFSNETRTAVVGPLLTETKTIVGGVPSALHPLELVTFEIQVRNSGAGTATNLRTSDALALTNATYVAGTMQSSVNGAAFASLTDAADADGGTLSGTTVQLLLASLPPSGDVRFRFQARVNAATGGLVMNNQATVTADQVGTADTNLLQVPIVGNATVTGRVFLDANGNGLLDGGETGIPNVSVRVTDSTGVVQVAVTDATGAYSVVVPTVPTGSTALNVDETDPDMPPGAILTTANDPQTVTAVSGSTVASANVGYRLPPITVVKTSSGGGQALPGQTLSYTIQVTNNTGVTQTGVSVSDAVPAGTAFVSATVRSPAFRVTEYAVGATSCGGAAFTGATCDLTLNQALLPNYFAIVQGADGTGGDVQTTPDASYAGLTADPFATGGAGGLAASGAANRIRISRGAASPGGSSWQGVVSVVECLADCAGAGFRLVDARRIALGTGATPDPETGTATSATSWTDASRVVLFGASNGAGCDTVDPSANNFQVCALRLFPSGTNTVNWERRRLGGAGSYAAATTTVLTVQWGSAWTVQRRTITGTAGGNGADAAGEYDTAAIAAVSRARTWVWGSANSADNGIGDGPEGVLITLGDGATQNATETTLAAGSEYNLEKRVEAHALTHPDLVVDYRFKVDGDTALATVSVPVNAAGPQRMALVSNGCNGTGTAYARPVLAARYASATAVELSRRRTGQDFPAWVQGVDFSAIGSSAPAGAPPAIVQAADGYSLAPGATMTITYQVVVDASPPGAQASVVNTASVATTQNPGPFTSTATDALVRPRVDVEPNNAGYANAGTTITFTHVVKNTGNQDDAYALTVTGERGWRVDLIDPDTGVVIASDTNADGTWDAGTVSPSTGTLAPGGTKEYQVRVWVPAGAPAGIQDTVRLRATSGLSPTVWDDAKDEITVLSSTLGSVIVTPDNSGVVQAGSYTAYAHRVINNTAFADTFDLRAPGVTTGTGVDSSLGWTNRIYWDTNGDGVYTPGTDLQILNTAQLPPGGSQLIFVVVNAPGGTASGTREVSHLTAWSRRDISLFGAATDTSTVVTSPRHDLSGGGSRVVAPGDTAAFPGTIVNLGSTADRFEIGITPSNLFGPEGDGLVHPTQLWVDTDGDGVPDLQVTADNDGNGTWDVPPPGAWDSDADGQPDVPVGAASSFAYELRRPIALDQKVQRDFV